MSDFSKTWKAMSVEQRAGHILRDWQDSRESNDPMVLRVAAAVSHAVLQELVSKADELRSERDEARRMWCEAIWPWQRRETPKQLAKEKGWDCYERKLEP